MNEIKIRKLIRFFPLLETLLCLQFLNYSKVRKTKYPVIDKTSKKQISDKSSIKEMMFHRSTSAVLFSSHVFLCRVNFLYVILTYANWPIVIDIFNFSNENYSLRWFPLWIESRIATFQTNCFKLPIRLLFFRKMYRSHHLCGYFVFFFIWF